MIYPRLSPSITRKRKFAHGIQIQSGVTYPIRTSTYVVYDTSPRTLARRSTRVPMSDDLPEVRSVLVEQAEEIIDEDTTTLELVEQLRVSRYRSKDSANKKGPSKPFEPMFKAVLLGILEGWNDRQTAEFLSDEEVAKRLGFTQDSVPGRSTLYRARTSRFSDAERVLDRSVEQIRKIAREQGCSIGPELTPDTSQKTSERSERREIRKRTREVLAEMQNVVFPALSLSQPDGAIYKEDDLLMASAVTGMLDEVGTNGGAEIYGDKLDSESAFDENSPFYADGPTGETVLESIKTLESRAISAMVNRAARKCFTRMKPYEEFKTPVTLAIDITYVGYYGERDEMVQLQGIGDYDVKTYDWCHKFATANIVGDNTKFTVGMLPVGDPDHHTESAYPGEDKTYRAGEVVRDLINLVEDFLSIDVVYADKEFYSADAFAALESQGLFYVIPMPSQAERNWLKLDDGRVWVKDEHLVTGPVKGGASNEQVATSVVVLPPDEDRDEEHAFATNLAVSDEIGLDRRRTKEKVERYRDRGAIEQAYKKIKEFTPMTTSKSFEVRLFNFGMGVLLYNMWLLVDFLVQKSMGREYQNKPCVTAERFRELVKDRVRDFLPG